MDQISADELHRRVPQPDTDDEVGRLAATMNRMLVRLEDSRNSQRRFVSDASHELRSPITTIREHAEITLAHPEQTSAVELAEVVLAEDLRMQGLVEDLLLLARVDEHAPMPSAAVDLDDLVFEEVQRIRATTSRRVDVSAVARVACTATPTRCAEFYETSATTLPGTQGPASAWRLPVTKVGWY